MMGEGKDNCLILRSYLDSEMDGMYVDMDGVPH